MIEIPLLTIQDVELRVAQVQNSQYGCYCTLLVYKDSRCDMRYLDKVFGPLNWKRGHESINGNLYCTVSVWDEEKCQWISKQDVGSESNTEATKGEASDSFKRACFNWGIGRELYNAPTIRFKLDDKEISTGANGKPKTYTKFKVSEMLYNKDTNMFEVFTVVDENNNVRFSLTDSTNRNDSANHNIESTKRDNYKNDSSFNDASMCSECGANITNTKVVDFSLKKFRRPLCYSCQKKLA